MPWTEIGLLILFGFAAIAVALQRVDIDNLRAQNRILESNNASLSAEVNRLRAIVAQKAAAIAPFDHDRDGKPGGGRRRQTI